ncbi:hypothetical protein BDZ89DRAFT_1047155 [Hymenopellis radicata]|nr:hypothetical protein BDZ89DRAFT_1047155 [Hymenopellis radicata]
MPYGRDRRKFPQGQWLRSLDALNIYRLAIAGGLTTALVLPGSANATSTTPFDRALLHYLTALQGGHLRLSQSNLDPQQKNTLVVKILESPPPRPSIIGRYKRESYRHSVYASRVLADVGIDVVLKIDHPLINLLHEAQQAHYYGLPVQIALSSVITTPARIMGLAHRIGSLVKGHDADVVVWYSHTLAPGAAPKQVYFDGIPQLKVPHLIPKPLSSQKVPLTPNFDAEAKDDVK